MEGVFGHRTLYALLLAVISVSAGLALGADINAVLIALVGSVAAVLIAASESDEPVSPEAALPRPAPGDSDVAAADILEAAVEPVLIVTDNRVVRANQAAHALLGRHIVGEDVRLAIRHPAAAERLIRDHGEDDTAPIHLVGLGTRDQRWEMRVRRVGRSVRIVHLTDRTGSYAAERMRVDFVANASHELRTPLASIIGFIETLSEEAGEDPAVRARFLTVMFNEAVRMQRLVDDLMSLSRIEAEKYREPDAEVDLAALTREVCAEIGAAQQDRASHLKLDIADIRPVKGDRAQLSQLLHNIIGNALKYGHSDTPVTIRLTPSGTRMAELRVTDQGEGIAPDQLPRLTERFYRIDSGRSRAMGGTGLGLSIVKHIVERHRGRLDIASTPGKGTTVTVHLPLQPVSS
ncbi:ATPase [Stakelama sp. CBK3Z-3]|uniref:histidine kinase n=1 Tax=Stakelama flava TaxID=2860338 RepID=A0ABS6XJJ7_9SPHN|nr:ATP-binding protein [Stakelama flava]MBW4330362.1 ATPase [Stakelama flava]